MSIRFISVTCFVAFIDSYIFIETQIIKLINLIKDECKRPRSGSKQDTKGAKKHSTTKDTPVNEKSTYNVAPSDEEINIEAKKTVHPHPPLQRKAVLIRSAKDFEVVDKHAIRVAGELHETYPSLITALTEHIRTDLEKVRAIFKWLTAKDLDDLEQDDAPGPEQSPLSMLSNIKIGIESYHHLFMRLCMYAGVHCVTVNGFSKGAGYQPGMQFNGTEFSNTWSAVLIDKDWRLIDCQWAARHVVAGMDSKKDMTYIRDEHYFLTDPDQLIYSHWAKCPEWQLLSKPISLDEFIKLPLAKSLFFRLGMKFRSHQMSVIKFGATEETIRLEISPTKVESVEIKFLLTREDGGANEKENKGLDNFVLQQKHKDHVAFGVRLPCTGVYHFEIFGKETGTSSAFNSPTFSCLCKYKIVHTMEKNNGKPFPACAQGEWGPGADCKRHGAVAMSHEWGTISPPNGRIEIKFMMLKPLQFVAKLVKNNVNQQDIVPYVMHRTVGKNVYFNVNLPDYGEYGLDIYAREEEAHESLFSQMCKYIINNVSIASDLLPFPMVPNRHWGRKPGFKELGLTTKSHEDPLVVLEKGETMTIIIGTEKDVSITYDFGYANSDATDVEMTYTFMHRTAKEIFLLLRPREIGFYRLHIYAKESGDPTEQLPNVFNYLIHNTRKRLTSAPFPVAYAMWNKCYLASPMTGQLMGKEVTQFKLTVACAEEVAVIVGDDWTYLTNSGEQWFGEVYINPACACAKVAACFDKESANFDTLLHFDVFKDF